MSGVLVVPPIAHGLVGRTDLPIPAWLFGWGAAVVLVVSFVALAVLWPKPRLEGARERRVLHVPAWLEIPFGLIGIGLFALEVVVTSYGLLTVGGVVALVLGAFALWTGVEPGVDAIDVSVSPWIIVIVVAIGVVYMLVLVRALLQQRRMGGVANKPVTALVGAGGTAQTLIAPTGIAYAGGESWSARSKGAEIGPGTPLRVVGVEGLELSVEPAAAGDGGAAEG
jgi:membrane-bound ClpP family serine protease